MYDYLVVGAGIFGAVFAKEMHQAGKKVLVLDKRPHIGGNVFTEIQENIPIHLYGAHLFHTNSDEVWKYVTKYAVFNNYQHKVKTTSRGKVYSLPFNMNTFNQMWGVTTPQEAQETINRFKQKIEKPQNLEEWALSQIGYPLYQKFVWGYTKKQWGRDPKSLPASIIKRIPIRFTYNDNYFDDKHQGVPVKGYSYMIQNILDGIDVKENADFFDITDWKTIAKKLIYSGPIDQLFNYFYGHLEYRTLRFEHKTVNGDFQGTSVMNYSDDSVPYTRIIEHQHFYNKINDKSIITYEYPDEWDESKIPYYPINDEKNQMLYHRYKAKILEEEIIVGGRLGTYSYVNMDACCASALSKAKKELRM